MDTECDSPARSLPDQHMLILQNMTLPSLVIAVSGLSGLNIQEKKDLLQSGYLGLVKAARAYDSGKGVLFKTFAVCCIRNEILRLLKKDHQKERELSSDPLDFEEICEKREGPEEEYLSKETLLAVKKAFTALSPKERQIINLRYGASASDFSGLSLSKMNFSGKQASASTLSQRETASMLGVSQPYVSKVEKNALKHLRENIKRELQ